MTITAWKLGNTNHYFAHRQDAIQTVRNTYSKVATVTDEGAERTPYRSRIVIEPFPTTTAHPEFPGGKPFTIELAMIQILDRATHL